MYSIATPTWVRIALVVGALVLITGTGLLAYHWYYRPSTLNVAVGSLDGEAGRVVSAIASRLAVTNASVRLNVVETSSAGEAANAFSSGKTELAVVRADVGNLSQAQAVIVVAQAVALLIATPGSSISDIADIKQAVVGVIGEETNRALVRALSEEVRFEPRQSNIQGHPSVGSTWRVRIKASASDADRGSAGRKISGSAAVCFTRIRKGRLCSLVSNPQELSRRSSELTRAS